MKHIIIFLIVLGLALLLSKYVFSVIGTVIETISSIIKSIFFPKSLRTTGMMQGVAR